MREEIREVVARALRGKFAWTFPLTHARALELADTAIAAYEAAALEGLLTEHLVYQSPVIQRIAQSDSSD